MLTPRVRPTGLQRYHFAMRPMANHRTLATILAAFAWGLLPAPAAPAPGSPGIRLEAAFGPEAGAEALVLKVLDSARQSIRLSAFALSSPPVVDALIRAKQRGVDVQVVADHHHNVEADPKGIGRRALDALVRAGIPVRTIARYRIHHDKFILVDARHVQTGSYNYAQSANANSENVLAVWDDPDLARRYAEHWQSRFDGGAPFTGGQ
jgi:phosphatidylserine/phosphatidylglycerophosphate/cardiolipin synthase-like enzyme